MFYFIASPYFHTGQKRLNTFLWDTQPVRSYKLSSSFLPMHSRPRWCSEAIHNKWMTLKLPKVPIVLVSVNSCSVHSSNCTATTLYQHGWAEYRVFICRCLLLYIIMYLLSRALLVLHKYYLHFTVHNCSYLISVVRYLKLNSSNNCTRTKTFPPLAF